MNAQRTWLVVLISIAVVGGGLALEPIRRAGNGVSIHDSQEIASVMSGTATSTPPVALTVNATPVYTDAFEHALDIELEASPGISMELACDHVVAEFISETLIAQEIKARDLEITETLSAAVATRAVSTSNWMEQFAEPEFFDKRDEWLAKSGFGMSHYDAAVAESAGRVAEMVTFYADVAKSVPTPTAGEINTFLANNMHLTEPSGRAEIVEFTFATESEMREAYEAIGLLLHDASDERPMVDRLLDYAHAIGLVDDDDVFDIVEYQYSDAYALPSHLASAVQFDGPGLDFGANSSGDPTVFIVLRNDFDAGLSEEDAETYAYESIMSDALIEAVDDLVESLFGTAAINMYVDCNSHRQ